jgi:hypothetical protein
MTVLGISHAPILQWLRKFLSSSLPLFSNEEVRMKNEEARGVVAADIDWR